MEFFNVNLALTYVQWLIERLCHVRNAELNTLAQGDVLTVKFVAIYSDCLIQQDR